MRLIGKVHDEITNIRRCECDNMYRKFKSAMTRAKNWQWNFQINPRTESILYSNF